MKTSRITLFIYLTIFAAVNGLLIALVAMPRLELARQALVERIGLQSERDLILVAWAVAAVASVFILYRLAAELYSPFTRLAGFIEKNQHTIALQLEDSLKEERVIKRFIDSQDMRAIDAESRMETMEAETNRQMEKMKLAMEKAAETEAEMAKMKETNQKLRLDNDVLKSAKEAAEMGWENERKSKVGVEVQRRSSEIYEQMERAVTNAALRSLWQPSRLFELKIQSRIIEKTAERLQKYWKEVSMSQLQDDLSEIQAQSQKQLGLLEALSKLEPQKINADFHSNGTSEVDFDEDEAAIDSVDSETAEDETEAATSDKRRSESNGDRDGDSRQKIAPRTKTSAVTTSKSKKQRNGKARPEIAPEDLGADQDQDDLFDYLKDLLGDISPKKEHVKIRLEVGPEVSAPEDREILDDLLIDLINLASERIDQGRITIKAKERIDNILFSIFVEGTPNPDFSLNLEHANRLAWNLDSAIEVEENRGHLLAIHYQHRLEQVPARASS